MGIKNGAPELMKVVKFGLYNRHANVYDINVDGENLQYKGYVASNLCQANAEAAIASNAHQYLTKTIRHIESWLGSKARKINIYMDGLRVINKESRGQQHFDTRLIRSFFTHHCVQSKWTILQDGESELQMYLKRDKSINLNVFISNDSDLISICYGHEPQCETSSLNIQTQDLSVANDHISDFNRIYANEDDDDSTKTILNTSKYVYDSCLWVNTNKQNLNFIGFDFIADKLKYNTQIFRVMIAMCGTDFTSGVLTNSQIKSLLSPRHENINKYLSSTIGPKTSTRIINNIVVALFVLSFREGGLVNRTKYNETDTFDVEKFINSIRIYCNYINTGTMEGTVTLQNSGLVVQHYLYAILGQQSGITGRALKNWASRIDIAEAIENCTNYLGTFDSKTQLMARNEKLLKRARQNDDEQRYNCIEETDMYGQVDSIDEFSKRYKQCEDSSAANNTDQDLAKGLDENSECFQKILSEIGL